jgi:hypothetical protein
MKIIKWLLIGLGILAIAGCGKNPMDTSNDLSVVCIYSVSSTTANNQKLNIAIQYGDADGNVLQAAGVNSWTITETLKPQSDGVYKLFLSAMPECPNPPDTKTGAAMVIISASVNGQMIFEKQGVWGYDVTCQADANFKFSNGKVIK